MQEYFIDLFGNYGRIIVFLHVLSASLLIGSMFMIRFIIKPIIMEINEEKERYTKCINILEKYLYFIFVIMMIIVSASFMMRVGLGFEYASPTTYSLVHVKEALWLFIAFNFGFMYWKFIKAKKLYQRREFFEVHENLNLIVKYLLPLNFILSLIAVYIGVIIRGF